MKTLLVAALCCSIVGAQQPPTTSVKDQIKTLRNAKRYRYDYDRFKDQTHVQCVGFAVKVRNVGNGVARVFLSSDMYFEGQDPRTGHPRFYVTFEAYSGDWRLLHDKRLLAIIEGTRVDFGEGKHDGRVTSSVFLYNRVGVRESLTFNLAAEDLNRLGTAKRVELQISDLELRLEDEHQQMFRDLVRLIAP